MQELDRVILGDNQFFAVNHKSQETAFAQAQRFGKDEAILSVIRTAYECGVRAMMLHAHPRAETICGELREHREEWQGFSLYPCIPYAFKYVTALNEKGFYPVLVEQVKKAGVGASLSMFLRGGVGLATRDFMKLVRVLVDLEMKVYRDLPLKVVFLHNVVVDIVLAMKVEGVLKLFADHVREKYGVRPGFGSLNLPLLVERMRAEEVEDAVIMTSVNKKGFFMNPSQSTCEEVLMDPGLDVVAMSILASGAIPGEEAFPYAARFPAVKSFLFGASRRETIMKSLTAIGRL